MNNYSLNELKQINIIIIFNLILLDILDIHNKNNRMSFLYIFMNWNCTFTREISCVNTLHTNKPTSLFFSLFLYLYIFPLFSIWSVRGATWKACCRKKSGFEHEGEFECKLRHSANFAWLRPIMIFSCPITFNPRRFSFFQIGLHRWYW